MKKIKDYIELDGDLSLFEKLNVYDIPWKEDADAATLELMYLTHSGQKVAGEIFDILTDEDENDITAVNIEVIARSIYTAYKYKWQRLWKVAKADYNPLENYNMDENGSITETGTQNGKTGENIEEKEETTENLESKSDSEGTATGNNEDALYGFASTSKVSSDSNDSTSSTTSTTGGESTRKTETGRTRAGETETENNTEKETTHVLTRTGNIGVRSSQELLTQEIELWQWKFFENVFKDIDKLIALDVY